MLKYRGTYRVVHEVDRLTSKPTENSDDTFIYCSKGGQIWRKSSDILVFERENCHGKNILDKFKEVNVNITDSIIDNNMVQIWFNEEDIDKVAKIVQARTLGANINPKSKRNLRLFGLQ